MVCMQVEGLYKDNGEGMIKGNVLVNLAVFELKAMMALKFFLFLLFVTQDAKPLEVYSIEFMVDNNQLGFLGE